MTKSIAPEQVILKEILRQKKAAIEPNVEDSEFFEFFVSEQVLKNFELSYEEIGAGIIGGGHDGGIDAIYAFANGELLREDNDILEYKKNINLELFIVQAKTSSSFGEDAFHKFIAVSQDVLDFSKSLSTFKSVYNEGLLQAVRCFQDAYKSILIKSHTLNITYVYATYGDTQQIHHNVNLKKETLRSEILYLFTNCNFDFLFLGARELLDLFNKVPSKSFELKLLESVISTNSAGAQGYLCLVSLQNYYSFITDENSNLHEHIFDANVRAYQGRVEVNKGIEETLASKKSEDFWWLNNGITMIAANGSIIGKSLKLDDPQIVNGLQTSREIFNYFKSNPDTSDQRSVLVRIIVTDNSASRDEIIKATNSQTAVPSASLKATDPIQRNVENFFLVKGLYYDRRKNFYKNQGRPKDKILDIPYLGQAIMAIVLREPDNSRARPSTLLKEDADYNRIFDTSYTMDVYLICAKIMKRVDAYIKTEKVNLHAEEKHNLKFHVAMYVAFAKLGKTDYRHQDVIKIDLNSITSEFLLDCLNQVVSVFRQLRKDDASGQPDAIAKSKKFVQALREHFEESLHRN